jgi:hypothetical protein
MRLSPVSAKFRINDLFIANERNALTKVEPALSPSLDVEHVHGNERVAKINFL